jgi:alkylation response protein AidB-like acyl-CoA dehydrogenase
MTATTKTDWVDVARRLGIVFAERAAAHDADDSFVAENYDEMKQQRLFSAGVPAELGGGGAELPELCAMLRELGRHCSSTALALSMHTHQVAIPAWRWRTEKAPVEGLLTRVANEQLVLVSSGGSDWLESSGRLERTDGGYRVTGRKVFSSGSPSGALLMTSAVLEEPPGTSIVLHFPLALDAAGVQVLANWRAMGMRGTGSNDVVIEDAFVPEAAIGGRRAKGAWGPFHLVVMIALPLVYSVYVGVAEAARELALARVASRRDDPEVQQGVGEMDTALRSAQIALSSAIQLGVISKPSPETTNEGLIRRTLIGQGTVRTVEKAMELVGGASFLRGTGLERLFRDVQGARFHPLPEKRQHAYTGRMALGLSIDPPAN